MLKKLVLVLAATALAASGTTWAMAATTGHGAATKKKKPVNHHLHGTVKLLGIDPPGPPPANGTQLYAGIADGTVAGKTIHGAVRGTNKDTTINGVVTFTGTGTLYGPDGTFVLSLNGKTGTPTATTVPISGTGKFTGGTGAYKGAKGTFTFQGNVPTDGKSPASFAEDGNAKY